MGQINTHLDLTHYCLHQGHVKGRYLTVYTLSQTEGSFFWIHWNRIHRLARSKSLRNMVSYPVVKESRSLGILRDFFILIFQHFLHMALIDYTCCLVSAWVTYLQITQHYKLLLPIKNIQKINQLNTNLYACMKLIITSLALTNFSSFAQLQFKFFPPDPAYCLEKVKLSTPWQMSLPKQSFCLREPSPTETLVSFKVECLV